MQHSKATDHYQLIRDQTRRDLEQHRSAERKPHSQEANNTLLAHYAEELQLANQRQQQARTVALQKLRERQKPKGNPMEDAFYEAWCKAHPDITIIRQYQVFKYRIDFAHPEAKIAIELDGQDFHSHKKDRNKDYARQHTIEDDGWYFVRFTGSQVWADVDGCISRVHKLIHSKVG